MLPGKNADASKPGTSVPDTGCLSRIPGQKGTRSQIRIRKIICYLARGNTICDVYPGSDFFPPRIRVRGSKRYWIPNPEIGIRKTARNRNGNENSNYFLETFFWVKKILKFFDADSKSGIWDGKNSDPG
jgi:hypothetical protein